MAIPKNWPNKNIEYLDNIEFSHNFIRQFIKKQCRLAKRLKLLTDSAGWLGELYANDIKNAHIGNVHIQYINEEVGYGLFAEENLIEGSFIGKYTGVVRHYGPFYRCFNDYSFSYPRIKFGYGRFTIDAGGKGNETRYINHSYNSNCEAVSAFHDEMLFVIIRTKRKITVGEQLLYNYGDGYWDNRDYPGDIT